MATLTHLTSTFAVTSALGREDFAVLARAGVAAVISNRPDGEAGATLTARDEAVLAWQAGLKFAHVPAPKLELFSDGVVEGMAAAVGRFEGQGLIVAHCASDLRSAIVWAAASARSRPVDCVLDALARAGFDLEAFRDDLESQAHRRWWRSSASAFDCGATIIEPAIPEFRPPARTAAG